MRNVEADQSWGVTSASTPGTVPAVKNGWLPLSSDGQWVINSVGVVEHSGQRILIAVLSDNQPSEFVAIGQVETAAEEAASAITADRSLRGLARTGGSTALVAVLTRQLRSMCCDAKLAARTIAA
jgi:hypothetical protein